MLLLPPVSKPNGADRRVRQRRRSDRTSAAQQAEAREAFRPDVEVDPVEEPARRGSRGRRSTDKPQLDEAPRSLSRAPKPYAPLVAQLIATALGLEQTRARRRGADADAAALYSKPREKPKRSRGDA